jgi:peroxiredoxin
VNPALDDTTFTLPTPDGYTEEVFTPGHLPEPLPLGTAAPDFSHPDSAGKAHALGEYRGKWVLIDFWGTWCGPCVQALPTIQTIHEEFKDKGVVVIGLSCNEPKNADPARMFQQKKITYSLLLDAGKTAAAYHVSAFPTLLLIDPEGKIAERHVGNSSDLLDELRGMLRKHVVAK